ncbi:MAK10-like protein [Tanacetum coccineum]
MGDENPIRTLGDYSIPSHEGYRNTIELPIGNNVVPLRSNTIRLVQNGCSFYGLQSEDPNQHLTNCLKLLAISLNVFQQDPSPRGEDLTTRFLAQFFPPGRTVKLRSDILIFQQHHGESLSEAWTRFKDLLQKVPHYSIDLWLQALLKDLALNNESWNDPRDFTKPIKAIALPQDVPSTSDCSLIELETQVQRLMEAHPALTRPTQVNKITTLYEICSGPLDTSINSDTEEDDISSTNAHENKLGNMVRRGEEGKEQGKEEDEMEIDAEIKEVIKDEENKIETDEEVEEIFEKEGMVMFMENDEKITFKMPHKMEIFKQTKLLGLNTDSIPPSA